MTFMVRAALSAPIRLIIQRPGPDSLCRGPLRQRAASSMVQPTNGQCVAIVTPRATDAAVLCELDNRAAADRSKQERDRRTTGLLLRNGDPDERPAYLGTTRRSPDSVRAWLIVLLGLDSRGVIWAVRRRSAER